MSIKNLYCLIKNSRHFLDEWYGKFIFLKQLVSLKGRDLKKIDAVTITAEQLTQCNKDTSEAINITLMQIELS